MAKFSGISIVLALILSSGATAENGTSAARNAGGLASVLMDNSDGCKTGPVAQFGRYIGDWDISDETLDKDGKTWKPGNGARWNFVCVGDGIAVQDFWMPNGPQGSPPPGVGTNLRIYDATSQGWQIAWTATRSPGFAHITARQNEAGNIVMHWASPQQNPPRRITFFTPTSEGWNWVMEMSSDGGKNWFPVYKIKATPRR